MLYRKDTEALFSMVSDAPLLYIILDKFDNIFIDQKHNDIE